jgi:hypothetical protein
MIATQMRVYNYSKINTVNDAYGQPQTTEEAGTVKMAINFGSEALQEHPLYSGAQYTGLTLNKSVDATYIIQYGEERLKVLYVNTKGKYTQVFMARM